MITLKELAKLLNVSVSTVSKALNDSEEISAQTIERVKKLANHYNYRPNRIAVSLKNNSTQTLGVVVPHILNRFFGSLLHGIERQAADMGYQIITCISNESTVKEQESIAFLTNGSVDGLLLAVAEETLVRQDYAHIEGISRNGYPVVMFDRVLSDFECDKVVIDDFDAIQRATQFLVDQGRRHIALISTIDDVNVGRDRRAGFVQKMVYSLSETPLVLPLGKTDDSHQKIRDFLKAHPQLDGIVSADNFSGIIAANIAKDMGYKIPEDINIIGFGDVSLSELTTPKLSYVDQNAEEIGMRSVKMLVDRLKDREKKPFVTDVVPVTIHAGEA